MLFCGSCRPRSLWGPKRFQAPNAPAPRLLTALLAVSASATPARPAAPEPVPSSHTLIVTAQDNGSSLILRPGETLQVVIGGTDGVLVAFDNVQGVAQIAQLGEGGKQAVVIPLMQADAGFIQHAKDPSQAGANLGGEADALGLTPREGHGGPIQAEVIKAHVAWVNSADDDDYLPPHSIDQRLQAIQAQPNALWAAGYFDGDSNEIAQIMGAGPNNLAVAAGSPPG